MMLNLHKTETDLSFLENSTKLENKEVTEKKNETPPQTLFESLMEKKEKEDKEKGEKKPKKKAIDPFKPMKDMLVLQTEAQQNLFEGSNQTVINANDQVNNIPGFFFFNHSQFLEISHPTDSTKIFPFFRKKLPKKYQKAFLR